MVGLCYHRGVLLPNAGRAYVGIRKLAEYCLDPTHPISRHKAGVFRSALGFTATDADTLRRLLPAAVLIHEAIVTRLDEFGQRYTVDVPVLKKAGIAIVRSAWFIRPNKNFPRLTTCFVLPD